MNHPKQHIKWPETITGAAYVCAVCNIKIMEEFNFNNSTGEGWFTPESKYWNVKQNEVYCSASHSLERHKQT